MRVISRFLINTPHIELWPGGLLRARGSHEARALSRASTVLRRKRDGCTLVAVLPEGLLPLVPRPLREPGMGAALDALDSTASSRDGASLSASGRAEALPLDALLPELRELGLDATYAQRSGLPLVPEPAALALAGFDRYQRALWLRSDAARAWSTLRCAAAREDVALEAISGYRSHAYQLGIFQRKRARGQGLEDILRVNAAPGYSEHHSGRAMDIGTPGEPAAEESFEATPAFAWLQDNAGRHGFFMSYPRGNPHGIDYEPWHWMYRPRI